MMSTLIFPFDPENGNQNSNDSIREKELTGKTTKQEVEIKPTGAGGKGSFSRMCLASPELLNIYLEAVGNGKMGHQAD
jgi:hypothetical protein